MTIPERYHVEPIPTELTHPFILLSHYAHRIPPITYAFGLYFGLNLKGICTFGRPIAHGLIKYAFQGKYQDQFIELNRLVVVDKLERNVLSFFVAQALKMLPSPTVVVSYADTAQNHFGFIYQATNWSYTGFSVDRADGFIKGLEKKHYTSISDHFGRGVKDKSEAMKRMYGDKFYYKRRSRKHRYFYFIGNKKERNEMKTLIIYPDLPDPKGDPSRYQTQKVLTLKRLI